MAKIAHLEQIREAKEQLGIEAGDSKIGGRLGRDHDQKMNRIGSQLRVLSEGAGERADRAEQF